MNGHESIAAERKRHVETEGWTPEHDDTHDEGEIAVGAVCYLVEDIPHWGREKARVCYWPWGLETWKPGDRRRNLVKAGAMIAAEIDRLDRAAARVADQSRCFASAETAAGEPPAVPIGSDTPAGSAGGSRSVSGGS